MDLEETKKRVLAASKLLTEETTNREKFESIRTLIKGLSPQLDKKLEFCSQRLSDWEKLRKGELIELTATHLPANTKEEKERKRALLLLIKSWRKLQSEVERVKGELEKISDKKSTEEKISSASRIASLAKGLFGLVTIGAILVVGAQMIMEKSKIQPVEERQVIREEVVSEDTALSYWVKEGKVEIDPIRGQVTWALHVHKEDPQTREKGQDVPAIGAKVSAELKSQAETIPLESVVGSDGWVRWTKPLPTAETSLYVTGVKGELPWAKADQNLWKNRPAATYNHR